MTNMFKNEELPTSNIYPNRQEYQHLGETSQYTPSVSLHMKETEVSNGSYRGTDGILFQPPLQKYNSISNKLGENSPRALSNLNDQGKNMPKPMDPQIRNENEHPNNPITKNLNTTDSIKIDFFKMENDTSYNMNTNSTTPENKNLMNGINHFGTNNNNNNNNSNNHFVNVPQNNNPQINNILGTSPHSNSFLMPHGKNLFTNIDKVISPPMHRRDSGSTILLNGGGNNQHVSVLLHNTPNQGEFVPNPLLSNVGSLVNTTPPLNQNNEVVVNPLNQTPVVNNLIGNQVNSNTPSMITNPLIPSQNTSQINLLNKTINTPLTNTKVNHPLIPTSQNVNLFESPSILNPLNLSNGNVVNNPLKLNPNLPSSPENKTNNPNHEPLINFTEISPENPKNNLQQPLNPQNTVSPLLNPLNTQLTPNPLLNGNVTLIPQVNLNNQVNPNLQPNPSPRTGQNVNTNPSPRQNINNNPNVLLNPNLTPNVNPNQVLVPNVNQNNLNPQVVNPQINLNLNPNLNPQLNQTQNVNPNLNPPNQINVNINPNLNPQHNPNVNPQHNPNINPNVNQNQVLISNVNPNINLNPQIVNPLIHQNTPVLPVNNQIVQVENEPDDDLIPSSELIYEFEIARGTFGVVYKGNWHKTDVAIKRLIGSKLTPKQVKEFKQEISVLKKLRHPNVVLFMGYSDDEEDLCIVTEYLSEGSVWNILHDDKKVLLWQKRLKIALDTALGMNYLHHQGIIHRDLKSPNLLCNEDYTVKICDFGLSKTRIHLQQNNLTACIGTYQYMAPEVIDAQPYSQKADVYSYGIVMWELLTREAPYYGRQSTQVAYAVVHKKERPPIPVNLPTYQMKYALIMQQCWNQNPKARPDFDNIVDLLKQLKSETPQN